MEPMIEVHDLHKSFGNVEVLKGIDLDVAPGQVVCVIGPSGYGKSTLLRCIKHLERPDAGYVRVDKYSSRSRTVYPLAPKSGFNPTISSNHFCVPRRLMRSPTYPT